LAGLGVSSLSTGHGGVGDFLPISNLDTAKHSLEVSLLSATLGTPPVVTNSGFVPVCETSVFVTSYHRRVSTVLSRHPPLGQLVETLPLGRRKDITSPASA
jgi:hypothetical protein